MIPTRRDLFTLGAGVLAGLPFTPIPWKLLDDVSIWSQNWPWVPTPPRGEPGQVFSACTLCAAACPMRVKTVAGKPIAVARVAGHPLSGGSLCALALGAHQLPWHPARLRTCLLDGRPARPEAALRRVTEKLNRPGAAVAFLDARPGRVASRLYAKFITTRGGRYLVARRAGEGASRVLARWSNWPEPLGIDFENAHTVVSFGVPVFEGAVAPGTPAGAVEAAPSAADPDRAAAFGQRRSGRHVAAHRARLGGGARQSPGRPDHPAAGGAGHRVERGGDPPHHRRSDRRTGRRAG